MIIKGNTVGSPIPVLRVIVGGSAPVVGPAIWFDTDPSNSASVASLLLDDNEGDNAVQVAVGDETYGINNATVNQGANAGNYDFTVL